MNTILTKEYESPVGKLIIGSFEDDLVLCDWVNRKKREAIDKRIQERLDAEYKEDYNDTILQTINQLEEYFYEKRRKFDLPIRFVGTDFQKQVWEELLKIPFGGQISYGDLSKKLKNKQAVRAVAAANGANAISIIVPCHRVVGTGGELTGYAGGLRAKRKLINLELPMLF